MDFMELLDNVYALEDEYYDFDLMPQDVEDIFDEGKRELFTEWDMNSGLSVMDIARIAYAGGDKERACEFVQLQAQECMALGDFGVYDELMWFVGANRVDNND